MNDKIYNEVITLLANKLNIDKATLRKDTYFSVDLNFTSFQSLEMICDVEDHFKCTIPEEELNKIQTIDNLVSAIENNITR